MTATNQSILSAAKWVQIISEQLDGLAEAAKTDTLIDRLGDPFLKAYYLFRLRKFKRALFALLNSCSHCDDPEVFLNAGNILHKAEEHEKALYCFNRTIVLLKDGNDQDTRLLALTGKLECLVAISRQNVTKNIHDQDGGYANAKYWHHLILQDLHETSHGVYKEISCRLDIAYAEMLHNSINAKKKH